ncbi:MAG: LysM peptidoglycan-binding domain-containing protein [Chlorobi bacterium]|nr:LysM peptidoglycan-binding domain-containing protein [Chlorobiota bacterium]
MECPVCNASGLPEDAKSCPSCGADLEALQLTKMIKKSGKGRLIFGYLASALFLIILVTWILNCILHWKSETKEELSGNDAEITALTQQVNQEKKLNTQLQSKIKDLNAVLNKKEQAKAKKKQQWTVKEGESLFTIARKVYGNGFKYGIIAEDNNISDPNRVQTGQKLIIYY